MSETIVKKVIDRLENEQIVVEREAKEVIVNIVSEAGKRNMYELGNDESIDTFVRNAYFDFEFVLMNKPDGKEKELTVDNAYELAKQYGLGIGGTDTETEETFAEEEHVNDVESLEEHVNDIETTEEPIFDIDKEIENMFMEARVEEEPEEEPEEELEEEPKEEPEEEAEEAPEEEAEEEPEEELEEEVEEEPEEEPEEKPEEETEELTEEEKDLEFMLQNPYVGRSENKMKKESVGEKVLPNNLKKVQETDTVRKKVEITDGCDIVKQITKHTEKLLYYRLVIMAFKGNLATLDKELSKINKYLPYKKALIENAKKNCVQIYSENVSLSKIKEEKKMLDTVGFVTELQEFSIKKNPLIDILYANGLLIKGFKGSVDIPVSEVYEFEKMNHINSVIGEEAIKHVEYTEIFETPSKKIKYNKSSMVKIPLLGSGNAYLIFTDTRIIISYYSELRIIDKPDVEVVSSAFEKKTLSTSYGQVQVTKKNGDMLVIILSKKDYRLDEKSEFDKRVSVLTSVIK